MVIHGLPFDNGGLKKIGENHLSGASTPINPVGETSTPESGSTRIQDQVEVSYSVPTEFPVRESVIQSISERLSKNAYMTPELLGKVSEQIINYSPIPEAQNISSVSDETGEARTEKVTAARNQIEMNFYDRPEIIDKIADKVIGATGFPQPSKSD
jgi:hypothetical protein